MKVSCSLVIHNGKKVVFADTYAVVANNEVAAEIEAIRMLAKRLERHALHLETSYIRRPR